MFRKLSAGVTALLLLVCCVCCFVFSKELFQGVQNGISICLQTLVPSMYCFMVLACLVGASGSGKHLSRPFAPIAQALFHLDAELFTVFLLSLLGGYPIGARLLSTKLERGEIDLRTAQFMLNFCVNCSPAFLISGVSLVLWRNTSIGLMIYGSQVLAALVIAAATARRMPYCRTTPPIQASAQKLSVLLIDAVKQATKSMGIICSFVVLFCGAFSLIDLLPLSEQTGLLTKGLLEVTSGCQMIKNLSVNTSILLVALFTSFGGICVHLQIMALLSGTKLKITPFLLWRIAYTALSVGFSWIGIQLLNPAVRCFGQPERISFHPFSVSPASSLFLLLMGILLLLFFHKSVKINHKGCSRSCSHTAAKTGKAVE